MALSTGHSSVVVKSKSQGLAQSQYKHRVTQLSRIQAFSAASRMQLKWGGLATTCQDFEHLGKAGYVSIQVLLGLRFQG